MELRGEEIDPPAFVLVRSRFYLHRGKNRFPFTERCSEVTEGCLGWVPGVGFHLLQGRLDLDNLGGRSGDLFLDLFQHVSTKFGFIAAECDLGFVIHFIKQEMEQCPIHWGVRGVVIDLARWEEEVSVEGVDVDGMPWIDAGMEGAAMLGMLSSSLTAVRRATARARARISALISLIS
jgi:hypothetical protein